MLNDTGDFYRFFDVTPHVEFLYMCVRKTIEEDLPYETDFLRCYDQFRQLVTGFIDMPDRLIDTVAWETRITITDNDDPPVRIPSSLAPEVSAPYVF